MRDDYDAFDPVVIFETDLWDPKQRDLRRQPEYPGIVRSLHAHQEIQVGLDRQVLKDFLQDPGRNLGRSAGGPDLLH